MQIDVTFTPGELARVDRRGRLVVVIDVVRATTTIVWGIANGCEAFLPVASLKTARRLAQGLPAAPPLLGGERGGLPIPGFDLSNSPGEYTRQRVAGKTIVFTTSNGTAAIAAARGAREILIAAFVNVEAVARYLSKRGEDIIFAAAGKQRRPSLDDIACAGLFVERMQELTGRTCILTDGARIALGVYQPYRGRLDALLAEAASGMALHSLDLGQDLELCAQVSVLDVVPRAVDGRIIG